MERRTTAVFECLAAAALFGLATPATKALLHDSGPLLGAGLLYLGAAAGALPFARSGGSRELRRRPRNVARLAASVLAGGCVAPACLLFALSRAPAATVALWLNLETVATALIAWRFFREPMSARAWVAVGLVTAAGILLGEPASLALAPAAGLAAIASAGWGLENNLVSVIDGFTPSQMTLVKGLVAGSVNLALGLGLEGPPSSGRAVYAGLAIGVLGYGVSIVLHVAGSQKIGAARGQALFSTAPFVGMTASWIALREPIESVQVGAALLMGAGIAVFLSGRHVHQHAHEAMAHTHDHVHDDGHHDHAHEGEGRSGRHTHPHEHVPHEHEHPHDPDLHHRHEH